MGIKRLSNNKYKVIVEKGYDPLGNRQRKTKIVNGTKEEAIKVESDLIRKFYHNGSKIQLKDITFEKYSIIYLNKYCNDIGLITKSGYERMLERIIPIIGKCMLKKINWCILDDLYRQLKCGKSGKTLGYHSMYGYYKLINLMLNKAVKLGLIDSNPNLQVDKPKREKKEQRYYNLDQVDKLKLCLKNESIKNRALIYLALDSGARRAEICALKWNNINFDTKELKIERSLKVVKGKVDEKTTKTENSKRILSLCDETIDILKEYKKWQDNLIKDSNIWNNENRVFSSNTGSYMCPTTCDHILRKIIKKYDLAPICFHELRHTSASILINQGINPKAVSERLGHADTSITMNIYTHTFDSERKAIVNVLNNVLKNR